MTLRLNTLLMLAAIAAAVMPASSFALNTVTSPSISGTPQAGQVLTVDPGDWRPRQSSYAYQWQRCNSAGAACATSPTSTNSATYLLGAGDVGYRIVALVAPNGTWSSAVPSGPTALVAAAPSSTPINVTRPALTGAAQSGSTLSVSNGTWNPAASSFLYAWHRCLAGICQLSPTSSNATTYRLNDGDVGYQIVAQVAPDGIWPASVNTALSGVVTAAPATTATPTNTSPPALSGTAQVGLSLSVTNGTWLPTPTSYAYAWHRCNSAGCTISPTSTNAAVYGLTASDVGYQIVAQIAPNGIWTSSANSAFSALVTAAAPTSTTPTNTSPPTISGVAQAGQTLSLANGSWNPTPTSYLYAWHRCTSVGCSLSPTSTNSGSYAITSGDVGYEIVAQVAPNGIWSASANSAKTAVVVAGASPPAASSGLGPIAILRNGSSYGTGSNYDKYSYILVGRGDAGQAAQQPGKALVYMSGVDISTSFSTGVDYSTALANGWLLKDASGNTMTGYGSYLGDVGSSAYQQAWIANVASFLSSTKAEGVYIDDVLSNIATWAGCGCFPAKYPSQSAWQSAMASFIAAVGPALKAKGFYVLASAHAYIPGNTGSDDASLEAAWWRQLAPSVSGLSTEYFTENQGNPSQLRSVGPAWYQHWDGWQGLVSVAQSAGADFFGLAYGTTSSGPVMRYMKGSFLIDWNGGGGAVIFEPTDGSDPWNLNWTAPIGQPSAAKFQPSPGVWERQYSAGTVVVNANSTAVTLTVNGVSRTIGATDALILTQ